MAHGFTRPYLEALFAVATPAALEEMLPPLAGFAATIAANEDLRSMLRNPAVPREAKATMVDRLAAQAGIDGVAARLLHVLLANHRILRLGEVVRAVRERLDRDRNIVAASLTTSAPLAEPEAERLRAAVEGRTGRTVRLSRAVDPALLGGFVVRVGSEVYDASLANRLRRTRQALHAGASQEGHHG